MNITSTPLLIEPASMSPELERLGHETIRALAFLLIPIELLYFSIYFLLQGQYGLHKKLTFLSLGTFWLSNWITPISCGPIAVLRNFIVATFTLKALDIFARRSSLPAYSTGKTPPTWQHTLLLLTEFRYESFTPNYIRVSATQETFNEPLQLAIHVALFCAFQILPQHWPLVLASRTWHTLYLAPLTSLILEPLRKNLPKSVARPVGVLSSFLLMAAFHIYVLQPWFNREALFRVGVLFVVNGFAVIGETMVWQGRSSWVKTALAWVFGMCIASWLAEGLGSDFKGGLLRVRWKDVCRV
ncbi:hypothetical protein CJF30_00005489 [Rutstroemia sp. NJR-2017a BBW]|nr:hypothetical protein CJF30_00005895 [Rutstroemia sp. NJR-2017a BBW]PQE08643.1 hypothetical protein CJF30_00005489 [Rutstroemia sp. NJR-2017a BBW]